MTWLALAFMLGVALALAIVASAQHKEEQIQWILIDACGFRETKWGEQPGYRTGPAPNIMKMLIRKDQVVAVMKFKIEEGPDCTLLMSPSRQYNVLGSFDSIIKEF